MSRGKAYRRWKTLSKYISRIKERMYGMNIQYAEVERETYDGKKYKRKYWRKPESWKEVDENNTGGAKMLKNTPVPYKEPWKEVQDHKTIKDMREESRRIIDEELNNDLNT
jgi:hypothetical protein